MKLRLLPFGLLLAAYAFAATAPAPAPWKPTRAATPPAAKPKPKRIINGVPDTGQFLPDTTWLIKVGPRITRIGDYVRQYNTAYPEFLPADDSLGRVQFMTTLINHDLLGLTARALDRPLDFTDRAEVRATEDRALSDVFYLRFVVDSARVRESDVSEYVQQRNSEAHFRRIVFEDSLTAAQGRAALVSGKLKWDDAVKRYSLEKPTLQNPNGDMGWVKRVDVPNELGAPLFRMHAGEISPVLRGSLGGYEISLMVERRQNAPIADDALLGYTRASLRATRISMIADSIQTVIRGQIGMVIDSANVRYASSRFGKSMEVKRQGYTTNVQISGDTPEFSDEDTSRVLARWNPGGRYSLGQFMAWYTSMNPMVRPDVTFAGALIGQVVGIVLEPYRAQMARERGLDKDPEVIGSIEGKREKLMVDHMYQDSVAAGVWVSREDRMAYYEQHKRDFITFPSVDFAMIYRYSRSAADSLVRALNAGARPWDIIAADSLRGEKTGSLQHRVENQKGTYQKVLFEELRPGARR